MARYDQNNTPYSWMPGFLRRFLNLDYDEPQEAGGSSYAQPEARSYAPAAQPTTRSTWAAPSEPTFTATNMESYTPPSGGGFTAPPPMAPRPGAGAAPAPVGEPSIPAQFDNAVKPVTYLLRAWFHGAMPPQGIGAFSKELRATSTDVWNLYSHWTRFQTEEIFGFGRGVLNTITENLPIINTAPTPVSRRIKVTVANGNGGSDGAVITPVDESKG